MLFIELARRGRVVRASDTKRQTQAGHSGGECGAAGVWSAAHGEPDAHTFHQVPRVQCGWGCGGWLTSHVMRAHFTRCPNRPAASPPMNHLDGRNRNCKAKRGRPPWRRMLCVWRCGT